MPELNRSRPPWWLVAALCLYVFTQAVNSWAEFFGPGSVGILPGDSGFTIVEVTPGLPMDVAGVKVGDEVLSVDGYPVAGMVDWFVVRANFQRDVPTPIEIRRGANVEQRQFVIRSANGEQLTLTAKSFQATRWIVLLLAAGLVFIRAREPWAWWLALILSAVALTEGNPSAGWLTTLRQLPLGLGLVAAVTTTSWLFIPVMWLGFCQSFPRPVAWRRGVRSAAWTYCVVFGAFVLLASVAMVFRVPALMMPAPFQDVGATRAVDSLFSVTPQLFLNPWPWYTPERQSFLLGAWLTAAALLLMLGFARLAATCRESRDVSERRSLTLFLASLGIIFLVGVHNALVRNWEAMFGTARPFWLSEGFEAAEGLVFAVAVIALLLSAARAGRTRAR